MTKVQTQKETRDFLVPLWPIVVAIAVHGQFLYAIRIITDSWNAFSSTFKKRSDYLLVCLQPCQNQGPFTLSNLGLFEMKVDNHETNEVKSLVVNPKQWFQIAL